MLLLGCGVLKWQDQPVAMVCFRTGKPLAPGAKSDLFLFVIDRKSLPDLRATTVPEFASFTLKSNVLRAGPLEFSAEV